MSIFNLIKNLLGKKANRSIKVSNCLSPKSEALLGPVPNIGKGAEGHAALIEVFFKLLVEVQPTIFCDVGANQGEVGRRALNALRSVRVFGFEANPTIYKNYSHINTQAGVNWINQAVCDSVGHVDLNVPKILERMLIDDNLISRRVVEREDTGKSSLLSRNEKATSETIRVPSTTLDHFIQSEGVSSEDSLSLWIDVEGAASIVLRGAHKTLLQTKLLVVEVEGFAFWREQDLVDSIIEFLASLDFYPCLRDAEYGDAQFNVVFLKDEYRNHPRVKEILLQGLSEQSSVFTKPVLLNQKQRLSSARVPVLVPCFNNPTHCDSMLNQLIGLGFEQITFVDNGSNSEAMILWLAEAEKSGVGVERCEQNLGPIESVFSLSRLEHLPTWFCVTDPDLIFNPFLPSDFISIMQDEARKYDFPKVGFALDVSQQKTLRKEKFSIGGRNVTITEWEIQFWECRLGLTSSVDPVFEASIDTTFALYDKQRFNKAKFLLSLRIAGKFTAVHSPWHVSSNLKSEEQEHYKMTQRFSFYA